MTITKQCKLILSINEEQDEYPLSTTSMDQIVARVSQDEDSEELKILHLGHLRDTIQELMLRDDQQMSMMLS